jgi:hypothetical protein
MENDELVNPVEFPILFTEDEMVALVKILDIAVRAQGLAVAEQALYFRNKLREVLSPSMKKD